MTKGRKGQAVRLGRHLSFTPGSTVNIGNNTYIGDRCRFEVGLTTESNVTIGDGCWLSHDCHIQGLHQVKLGRNVLVGEFVSIRDTTHVSGDPDRPVAEQGDTTAEVAIEDDVWVGRGCLIQAKGSAVTIGHDAIIGANSVVIKSIPPKEVWAGAPARFIRKRG